MSFIPNKFELISKLDGLRDQAKKKYIDIGGKLLVFSANTMSSFVKHLIVLQGKDPNAVPQEKIAWKDPSVVAAVNRVVSDIRPSFKFSGGSRGWSQGHFKNPEKYHPILVNRIKMDEKGVLNVTKEPENTPASLKVVDPALGEALSMLAGLEEIDPPLKHAATKEDNLEVEVVSGSRQVSTKKAKSKISSKKVVKVKRVKKGVFRRVED